ncbi:T5orf172 domain-containing protein [Actinomadura mexicana]|uniref:T5orf172 domain-containing protein n=1 Tax=Actinomadura mexicana TaxID=134959 RepID=A0A239GWG0_9ACTN|nr:T5orf172 domain-containing protein [Actinomadura mexicana]
MVNGLAAQGGKIVRDFSKLMLRAYNAEADNLVRTMRPYKLQSAIERLDKSAQTIERLGKTMDIRVSRDYRAIRVKELRLTADHLAKAEEEKERVRAERERQREEEKARKEFEREKARLLKERSNVESALARLEANGNAEGAADLRAKLADVDSAISDVEGRAANVRAGCVYVISNIGAFGERMVKIGMTRRLEPMDRVRELGDASVPFRFDVHALIFSDDAVGLENKLHQEFSERRVNQVNLRREFFYATPAEVREVLERIAGNHLLEYNETPEALEYRAGKPA